MYRKHKTNEYVWAAIKIAHPELQVFSSYSNPSGDDGLSGQRQMMTEFGLPGAPIPLVGARTTWERGEKEFQRVDVETSYWLCVPLEDDE